MPSRWVNPISEFPVAGERVISVGRHHELLSLRQGVLETAGFRVFTTSDIGKAILRIENGKYDVLLICHSLAEDDRQKIVSRFREFSPQGRVVAITNEKQAASPAYADGLVYGVEGAEALSTAVQRRVTDSKANR